MNSNILKEKKTDVRRNNNQYNGAFHSVCIYVALYNYGFEYQFFKCNFLLSEEIFNYPYNGVDFPICAYVIFYWVIIDLSDNCLGQKFCYQEKYKIIYSNIYSVCIFCMIVYYFICDCHFLNINFCLLEKIYNNPHKGAFHY